MNLRDLSVCTCVHCIKSITNARVCILRVFVVFLLLLYIKLRAILKCGVSYFTVFVLLHVCIVNGYLSIVVAGYQLTKTNMCTNNTQIVLNCTSRRRRRLTFYQPYTRLLSTLYTQPSNRSIDRSTATIENKPSEKGEKACD